MDIIANIVVYIKKTQQIIFMSPIKYFKRLIFMDAKKQNQGKHYNIVYIFVF